MFTAATQSFQVIVIINKNFKIISVIIHNNTLLITVATKLHAAVREWRDLDLVDGGRELSYLLLASSPSASIGTESSLRTQSSNSSLGKFRLSTSSEL